MKRLLILATAIGSAALAPAAAADDASGVNAKRSKSGAPTTRDVLFVGNNWAGTADVIDVRTYKRLARIDIVPDKAERLREIMLNPVRQGYFLAIRQAVGEGNDQFVDDMFSSPDGRTLYVSRPSFADVTAFDLTTRKIVWRVPVDGYRADHMAISPDGKRLVVSASTARTVDVIDVAQGKIVGRFPSGDQPHENNFSRDGKLIFHASIGTVYTPNDSPEQDATKGERVFEVVDAQTLKVLKRVDMGQRLAAAGYPNMSSAVRPMAIAPDENIFYFQISFLHGFVEYDLRRDKVLRVINMPISAESQKLRRDEYVLDSAQHGLAMNPEGTKLCVAGTMSNYAALVRRKTMKIKLVAFGKKPYWATNSGDGKFCFVSFSGDDAVSVISYKKRREVARIPVGDHPQRMRMGRIALSALR